MLSVDQHLVDPLTVEASAQIPDTNIQDIIIKVDKVVDIADALMVSCSQRCILSCYIVGPALFGP